MFLVTEYAALKIRRNLQVVASYVIPNTYHRVPNIETLCMLGNLFFCPEHFLNPTDLSPSSPARRFAEPDLGLNCLYDKSQTFS